MLELDELWSFVQKKAHAQWVWIALCRRTRQVVAYAVGPRDWFRCRELYEGLPPGYRDCVSFSDFWANYDQVFPRNHSVDKRSGATAHVERFNNTIRPRLARFVRKTLSFSKLEEMHRLCLHLFFLRHNQNIKSF